MAAAARRALLALLALAPPASHPAAAAAPASAASSFVPSRPVAAAASRGRRRPRPPPPPAGPGRPPPLLPARCSAAPPAPPAPRLAHLASASDEASSAEVAGVGTAAAAGHRTAACEVSSLLEEHSFGHRLFALTAEDVGRSEIFAETYESGRWGLCVVTGLVRPPQSGAGASPRVEVLTVPRDGGGGDEDGPTRRTVGVSDVTTFWRLSADIATGGSSPEERARSMCPVLSEAVDSARTGFPVGHAEGRLRGLYDDRAGRTAPPRRGGVLTKKQIPKVAAKMRDPSERARAEEALRAALKAGPAMGRLVDSSDAGERLYGGSVSPPPPAASDGGRRELVSRRLAGAEALSADARLGGRFRRAPCSFVSARYGDDDGGGGGGNGEVLSLTVLNGGWVAVDAPTRAGAEGRKFAERTSYASDARSAKGGGGAGSACRARLATAADERIADRLERLAMGEDVSGDGGGRHLEVDVREALRAMGLPPSPEGARRALVKIGRWSEGQRAGVEPWPRDALDAAGDLARYEARRREELFPRSKAGGRRRADAGEDGDGDGDDGLEGRVDLADLPCLCVDAPGTKFRDDALGIRTRASTGRRVMDGAGKWEVLVHIADLSDVYSPVTGGREAPEYDADLLREAAERRGYSRYDLPLGPLHLMPPVALGALSLRTDDPRTVNRCVTLWAYIDERSGKLLDAGMERTLISSPMGLTYRGATELLKSHGGGMDVRVRTARGILTVAERILSKWADRQLETSDAARRRRDRMDAKEMISREGGGAPSSFLRTRAHRVVDAALDLYGRSVSSLLRRAGAPIPAAAGRGPSDGGRVRSATAPLRRYVDGMAQYQAAAALCGGGGRRVGPALSAERCAEIRRAVAESDSAPSGAGGGPRRGGPTPEQRGALRALAAHVSDRGTDGGRGGGRRAPLLPAVATGRENEVVLSGAGVAAKCRGVRGTLRPGDRVTVEVSNIDPEGGRLTVRLARK